jgi:hypothetical protein
MKRRVAALLFLSLTTLAARAAEVDVTWDGSNGNWTDSARWGLASGYPDNTLDPPTTYGAAISAGTVTLDALSPVIDNLSLTGGTLTGTGSLTVGGTFNWSGAFIGIASMVATGTANLTLASPAPPPYAPSLVATAFTLDSAATFNLSLSTSQTFNFQQHATFTNNGTFNVLTNTNLTGYPNGLLQHTPDGRFINNGTLNVEKGLGISSSINFDNAGTINILKGNFIVAAVGNDSASSVINVSAGARILTIGRNFTTGSLHNDGDIQVNYNGPATSIFGGSGLHFSNAGAFEVMGGTVVVGDAPAAQLTITPATATSASTFINTGTVEISDSATLHLYAAQDPATTGVFTLDTPNATLDLAADYSFATATDPTLTGNGLVIVDPGTALTLAADTAFTGTIQVEGTLIIAPPRDPNAPASSLMQFTVVSAVPEPASLGLLGAALVPLLGRRRCASRRKNASASAR